MKKPFVDLRDFSLRYFALVPLLLWIIWANLEYPQPWLYSFVDALNFSAKSFLEFSLSLAGVQFKSGPGFVSAPTYAGVQSIGLFVAGCSSYLAYFTLAALIAVTRSLSWVQRVRCFLFAGAFLLIANNVRITIIYALTLVSPFSFSQLVHDFFWLGLMGPLVLFAWLYFIKRELYPKGS